MTNRFPWMLLAGDCIALLAFVLLGQADHDTLSAANVLSHTARNWVSLGAPWIVMAMVLGAYPARNAALALRPFLLRSGLAWLLAAPMGLWIRKIWLARGAIPVPFLLVTLAAGGLMLLGWRAVYGWRRKV